MEHEYPSADVIFLGHTHQSEFLTFRRDQEHEYRVAIIGGTYKEDDEWAAQAGIGGRGKLGGLVLKLRPDTRHIEVLQSLPDAEEYFNLLKNDRVRS